MGLNGQKHSSTKLVIVRKDGCLYKLRTPGRGDIFVENPIVNRITHSVGEIFF